MIKRLIVVFVLLGLISLTADMVYEGARSASGAYLEHLKAPPIASSIIGAGEFVGYVLRFIGALLATYLGSSAAFWGLIAIGYALNVMVLPLLAFTSAWSIAVSLYLLERVGKGLRAPLRDVVLAEVTEGIGRGKGFGLHELMDQVGALAGPLLFAYMLATRGYTDAFFILVVPGSLAMLFVATAWSLYPKIKSVDSTKKSVSLRGLGEKYWLYVSSMVLQSLGFVHWAIASYFLKYWGVLGDAEIALLYAVAMGVDAIVALPVGYLYDVVKYRSLYLAPLFTLSIIPLLITKSPLTAPFAAVSWGIVMGVSETIMRASIADITGRDKLAVAYGVFGMLYGISWTIGGFIITILMQLSEVMILAYVAVTQLLSIFMLTKLNR